MIPPPHPTRRAQVGFTASPQRLNVALTRARHHLLVLGDRGALARGSALWGRAICGADAVDTGAGGDNGIATM
jgi:superfamily I DNA and/or RNA helicase